MGKSGLLLFCAILLFNFPGRAAVIQVFGPAGLNGPVTVHDFELVAGGPGATYSDTVHAMAELFTDSVTSSGTWGLGSGTWAQPISITFDNLVTSVGMYFGNDDTCCTPGYTAHLDAFDSGAVLLGTVSVVANMNDWADQFIGFNSTARDVKSVTLRYGSGTDVAVYTFIDDVQFNDGTVPEPGTVLLVGAGLALALWRRFGTS